MKQYKVSATLDAAKGIVISYKISVDSPTPDLKKLKERAMINFNDATEKLVRFNQIEIKEIRG